MDKERENVLTEVVHAHRQLKEQYERMTAALVELDASMKTMIDLMQRQLLNRS